MLAYLFNTPIPCHSRFFDKHIDSQGSQASLREGAGVACKDSWGPSLRHAGIPEWEAKESGG